MTGKILLAATLALALAGTAAAKTTSKVIGHGTALKGGKISYASATAKTPKSVSAKVITTPKQTVKLQWSVICTKAGGTTDADAYNSSTTPSTGVSSLLSGKVVQLKLPFTHPSSCAVTVYSTLAKKGKQTLEVLQD
jgi:hypothetical protein